MNTKVTTQLGIPTEPEHKVTCNRCTGITAHTVLAVANEAGASEDYEQDYQWHTAHQLVQCLGCKSISYRVVSTNSNEYYHDDNDQLVYIESVDLFPPRIAGVKGLGEDVYLLPKQVRLIYEETLKSLSAQSPILAAIGLRALVETVCKDNQATGRDLYEKISSLVAKRVLTPVGAEILQKIRSIGNAAAHEVKPHNEQQLSLALTIVEHLLNDVYILPKLVKAEFGQHP